jgi:hypothetical protein
MSNNNNKNKKESATIGIIGGADGPTVVYVANSKRKTSDYNQWQRVLDACKGQAVTRERHFTGEEIKDHIIETYGAKEIEPTPTQKLMLKINVLSNCYPEALQQSAMPDKNADKKEWLEWARQEHVNTLDIAQKVSDETYGLRYAVLRIPRTEITEVYYLAGEEEQKTHMKKHEKKHKKGLKNILRRLFVKYRKRQFTDLTERKPEIILEIELSTGYMMMQNGCSMLMNEIILWQGVTKEDIEKCTPRFMAFGAAMRDTGKLNL